MKPAKKLLPYLAAPGMVIVIAGVIFWNYNLFPFGSQTAAWCDMYQQVIPFLMDIKDMAAGNAGMFLNLQNAGGMNFWGVFLFFACSPFTLLVLLVSKADIYLFVNVLILLKMMLCAVTVSHFFRRTFPGLHFLQNTALSVMYAFCGYTMFYFQNHVWLDMMYLLPLLLLSMKSLRERHRVLPYILTLTSMIIIHFYLSYMVLLFLILAFGVYTIFAPKREDKRKVILLLGISTGISALLTCAVWLPAFLQYLSSARTGNLIENLQSGDIFTEFQTTGAFILCSAAIFACLPLLPRFKRTGRDKNIVLSLFFLLFFPILIEPVNKMWHTGSYQAFPVRYGYITVLFGLILLAMVLTCQNRCETATPSRLRGVFMGTLAPAAALIIACLFLKNKYHELTVYTRTLWGNDTSFFLISSFALVMAICYLLILVLYRYRYLGKTAFSLLLCACVCVESGFYTSVYFGSASAPVGGYQAVVDLADKIPDPGLFRVKVNRKYFDANLVGGLGYGSLGHYSSLTSKSYHAAMKKLGYSSYWMEVNSNGGTALTDAILSNKYQIALSDELKEVPSVEYMYDNTVYTIYRNPLAENFGIVANGETLLKAQNLAETGDRFTVQEQIFNALFSGNSLITRYAPDTWNNVKEGEGGRSLSFHNAEFPGSFVYHISVTGNQTLYFDCFDQITNDLEEPVNKSFDVYVNGRLISENYPSQSENGLLELGTFQNEEVTVLVQLLKPVHARSLGVAGMDMDLLESELRHSERADLKQDGSVLTGNIMAEQEGQYLFLPVADPEDCTSYVNGEKCDAICVFDSFIAVPLQKGNNNLRLSFSPAGFQEGKVVSIMGLLMLPGFLLLLKRGGYHYIKLLETPVWFLFLAIFCIAVAAVYIFPLIVYYL